MPRSAMIIAGATATGKSAVAQLLAERTGAAIVSADSMLVYRGMDVGTAKPTPKERSRVRYIGLDCVEPGERFSVGDWLERVAEGVAALPPETPLIVAGGTGLYIKALLEGLDSEPSDPAIRSKVQALYERGGIEALRTEMERCGAIVPPGDAANPRRLMRAIERAESAGKVDGHSTPDIRHPDLQSRFAAAKRFCLDMDRDALASRIEARAIAMFDNGIVEEALAIFGGGDASETASGAIGYAEALAFARGELSREEALARVAARTRQLAKRQRTWFRHQFDATPIPVAVGDTAESVAGRIAALSGDRAFAILVA